jgi:hypothetical protein
MNFIDEQDRPDSAYTKFIASPFNNFANVTNTSGDSRQLHESSASRVRQKTCEGGFPRTWRAPQNHGHVSSPVYQTPQRPTLAEEVPLPDHLIDRAGANAHG